jgi:hypothetical protein
MISGRVPAEIRIFLTSTLGFFILEAFDASLAEHVLGIDYTALCFFSRFDAMGSRYEPPAEASWFPTLPIQLRRNR